MPKYSVTGEVDSFWGKHCLLRKSVDRVARDSKMEGKRMKRGGGRGSVQFPSPNETLHISLKDKVLS